MAIDINNSLQKAYDFIAASQNADGGWGYRRGGMSYVEPTTFALLALFSPDGTGGQNIADSRYQTVPRGLEWLRSQQHADGGWGIMKDDPTSGWMTYPVVWMLNVLIKSLNSNIGDYFRKEEDVKRRDNGRNWIITQGREAAVDPTTFAQVKKLFEIDSNLLGFSWGAGESGWVIPTALAMVALILEDPPTMLQNSVVVNAKDYLRDRACPKGGWNVGNPWMLGKQLPATTDATSFALVAWRLCLTASDFGVNTDVVNGGLDFLRKAVYTTNSDHTVALCAWALSLFDEPSDLKSHQEWLIGGLTNERTFQYQGKEIKKRTVVGQDERTGGWANSAYTTAIATLALTSNRYYLS